MTKFEPRVTRSHNPRYSGLSGLRGAVASSRRGAQIATAVGVVVLALALLLVVNGRWMAGGVTFLVSAGICWLSGLWATPWSSDGYVRRVTRAIEAWATVAQ